MPLLDINKWLDGFKQRAIKLAEIIPQGTPVKSTFDPNQLSDFERQGYIPYEGEYLGIDLESPFPIHLIKPATKEESYSNGDYLAVFWEGRWQSVDEIIGA
jgi:hypothetical protein